jgi:SAM-dependent methyltransferase
MSEAETWALGDYGRLAKRLAPLYDTFVTALAAKAGERWLDVATGTGGVALRAARDGAQVTALDLVAKMLDAARADALKEGLDLELVEADARAIPFGDESFDVVSSCLGFGFDDEDAAPLNELVRVCRRGGRLGILLWRPTPDLDEALRPVTGSNRIAYEQSTPERAHELLDRQLDIETAVFTWYNEDASPDALYEFTAAVNPPTAAYLRRVGPEQQERFREALVGYWRRFVTYNGVRVPSDYLVVTGRKR